MPGPAGSGLTINVSIVLGRGGRTSGGRAVVRRGGAATVHVGLRNAGRAAVSGAKLRIQLPAALTGRARTVRASVARIASRASRTVRVPVRVGSTARRGVHRIPVRITVDGRSVTRTLKVTVR
ncbi:hypothetical protein PAI11_17330 [Patulibacter medicamentivorans]|uniref:DUF11 domain-containing protein n=1 Tax=Patulibacter medicamentivorans TaxID=1097667 RepID=H0E4K2_9ACTN|nr:hypothetical protein PAI11_17330 [Patulibacter medicamentivorans]